MHVCVRRQLYLQYRFIWGTALFIQEETKQLGWDGLRKLCAYKSVVLIGPSLLR